jgi:hypothetical protein
MRTKPTNYQAAKELVQPGEHITVSQLISRLLDSGRRELPTKRELSARMTKDPEFLIITRSNGNQPTVFMRSNKF